MFCSIFSFNLFFFFPSFYFCLRLIWVMNFTDCSLFPFFPFLSLHCSYHWIKRKGKPAPRELAPIVVSNHLSFVEPIFYFYELSPTIVASESHDSLPFVGTIIRAMQVNFLHLSQQIKLFMLFRLHLVTKLTCIIPCVS